MTKGASAVLRYNAIMTAVSSEELDEYSEEFEKMLTKDERAAYSRSRQNYYGGLNIPMLLWIGINLDGNVSREDMEHARRTQLKYDEKARYIAQKLRDHKSTTVKIRGRLTATGVSFIPTVAEAYIKVAKVMLNDGSVLTVASSSANDVAAASNDGSVVPSSDGKLNIV